jgi:hypothetical protein
MERLDQLTQRRLQKNARHFGEKHCPPLRPEKKIRAADSQPRHRQLSKPVHSHIGIDKGGLKTLSTAAMAAAFLLLVE